MLVTLNEMLGLPPALPSAPALPTYQPPPLLPTYNPAPAPLPTYTSPNLCAPPPICSPSPPLPTYNPSAVTMAGAPEPSRAGQQVRVSGVGQVRAPPPHGLPPTHHALSPRNLNSLRNGQGRQKSHSASRTSLASSSGDPQPQHHQNHHHHHHHQFQDPQVQHHHDPYLQPQQPHQGGVVNVLSRSSLDSGSSAFPAVEAESHPNSRSSPSLSPPPEVAHPPMVAAAPAPSSHRDAALLPVQSQQQALPQPSRELGHGLLNQPLQQQQQQGRPHDSQASVAAAAAKVVVTAGHKSIGTSKNLVGTAVGWTGAGGGQAPLKARWLPGHAVGKWPGPLNL